MTHAEQEESTGNAHLKQLAHHSNNNAMRNWTNVNKSQRTTKMIAKTTRIRVALFAFREFPRNVPSASCGTCPAGVSVVRAAVSTRRRPQTSRPPRPESPGTPARRRHSRRRPRPPLHPVPLPVRRRRRRSIRLSVPTLRTRTCLPAVQPERRRRQARRRRQ